MGRLFLLLFFCCVLNGNSQNLEASQWHFTAGNGLSLLTNPPIAVTSSINTLEGSSSIADLNGNLLFYTNGVSVWNSNHALMPNSIGGDPSSFQAALIYPKSGSEYYIFTTGAGGTGSFGYSIVDMSLAGGLGSVTASYVLRDSVAEKLTAVRHCNGTDIWVLIHKTGNNAFEAYQAGPTGVTLTPVVSYIGPVYTGTIMSYGNMKFSPQGNKLAVTSSNFPTNYTNLVELYDFNSSNGVISNQIILATYNDRNPMGVEFAPDGSKLYSTTFYYMQPLILQWDLCAGNAQSIIASLDTVGSSGNYARGIQNAIDGKLYFLTAGGPTKLGVIAYPNQPAASCGFSLNLITIPNGMAASGLLPNFLTSYFRQKTTFSPSATTSLSCGNVTFSPLQFCAGAGYTLNSYNWNFGDPGSGAANTSSLSTPVHAYSANGVYTVSLVSNYNCFSDTVVQTVTVTGLPTLTVAGKNNICLNETTTFTVSGANTYSWSTGALTSTLAVNPSTTTVYTVTGTDNNSCSVSKTLTLSVKPCTGISNHEGKKWLELYPNPGKGIYNIELTNAALLRISDISGRVVFEQKFSEGKHTLNMETQENGVYFLSVASSDHHEVIKLLKE